MTKSTSLAKTRGIARKLAMQATYQWQMTGDDVLDIKQQFLDDNQDKSFDADYFKELLLGATANKDNDALMEQYMDRDIEKVDPVERAILRIACYELRSRSDVPYRVVIDEAITLTKKYCAAQSHKFINAVLDKTAAVLRQAESR